MQKRFALSLGAVALVVATVASLTLASAAPERRDRVGAWGRPWSAGSESRSTLRALHPAITAPETFTVFERQTRNKFVNTDGPGFTAGDYFLFRSLLFDKRGGRRVGAAHVQCTFYFSHRATCEGAADFGKLNSERGRGQIEFYGSIGPPPFVLAVTGGTGDFDNVRGQIVVRPVSNTADIITFHLTP
jgi:hypothetical protein